MATGATRADGRRCVLVTGASRSTGRRLIKALAADERVGRVIAVDSTRPPGRLPPKVKVVQAELGSPALIKALESAAVDTLVHLG